MNARHRVDRQPALDAEFADVVDALAAANADAPPRAAAPPSRGTRCPRAKRSRSVVADLRAVLFPAHFGPPDLSAGRHPATSSATASTPRSALQEQVRRGLLFACAHDRRRLRCVCEQRAGEVMREFARRLPGVRTLLGSDVRAAYEGDPAATSPDEAVFCYPGITAITHHRLAHELYALACR